MWRQRTQKKSELQMGIEPMTFRTLVGRSTTEPQELMASEVTILPGYDYMDCITQSLNGIKEKH